MACFWVNIWVNIGVIFGEKKKLLGKIYFLCSGPGCTYQAFPGEYENRANPKMLDVWFVLPTGGQK